MMTWCSRRHSEVHSLLHSAMIPEPCIGHPDPHLDEGAKSTGGNSTWGHTLGKKAPLTLWIFFKMLMVSLHRMKERLN